MLLFVLLVVLMFNTRKTGEQVKHLNTQFVCVCGIMLLHVFVALVVLKFNIRHHISYIYSN